MTMTARPEDIIPKKVVIIVFLYSKIFSIYMNLSSILICLTYRSFIIPNYYKLFVLIIPLILEVISQQSTAQGQKCTFLSYCVGFFGNLKCSLSTGA